MKLIPPQHYPQRIPLWPMYVWMEILQACILIFFPCETTGQGHQQDCGLMQSPLKGIPSVFHLKTRRVHVPETRAWKEGLSQIGKEISVSVWTLVTMSGLLEAPINLRVLCDDREEKASSTRGSSTAGKEGSYILKELVIFCQII